MMRWSNKVTEILLKSDMDFLEQCWIGCAGIRPSKAFTADVLHGVSIRTDFQKS